MAGAAVRRVLDGSDEPAPLLATVVRDGVVESVHRGHVAVTDSDGTLLEARGRPTEVVYPRSALKPFQAAATRARLAAAGHELDAPATAIASASHEGSADQQVEAARLLALAGVDERALRCPVAFPTDPAALIDEPRRSRLAHNCSGKHAGFLCAQVADGLDPAGYLDASAPLQREVAGILAEASGATPEGPGTDGCGAPAWRLPLSALATAFARLAAGWGPLESVGAAMRAHPLLVAGTSAVDGRLMRACEGVVAKRGAEGVLACGVPTPAGAHGVAVKVADGALRGCGPAISGVLGRLGVEVPSEVATPPVLGGDRPCGSVRAVAW